jgi:hypothetical protein
VEQTATQGVSGRSGKGWDEGVWDIEDSGRKQGASKDPIATTRILPRSAAAIPARGQGISPPQEQTGKKKAREPVVAGLNPIS